jgi:hypothetical protein
VFRGAGYLFAGLFAGAVAAFWPDYLSRLGGGGIRGSLHLHAIAMALWFALLIIQPFLIRAGRRKWHRRLGAVSYAVAPVAVVTSVILTHAALVRAGPGDPAAATFSYLPLAMGAWFAICYGLAIAYRRRPALHARFMIGTGIAAIDPIAARVAIYYFPPLDPSRYPLISWAIAAAILLLLIWIERGQSRARAVFPAMLAAISLIWVLWFTLAPSAIWRGFAAWFAALPLP